MILRPCVERGCPELASATRCHAHARTHERQRPTPEARGYDWSWRKLSRAYRMQHALCEYVDASGKLCSRASVDTDHIRPVRAGGLSVWSNCKAYCRPHHARKTREDAKRWPE